MKFISHSLDETISLAKMFARGLNPGDVVISYGNLGAGKTAFSKGIGLGLGVKQIINSPTFNIMKVYKGEKLNFYHIDAYRLEDKDAVSDIGLDEAISSNDGISYIEWPMFISNYLKDVKNIYTVWISYNDDGTRTIKIEEGYYEE